MIRKLLFGIPVGIVVAVLIVCAVIAMQPSEFKITRTATVNAPPDAVFAQVNDFHKWDAWSPWAKIDPNMKTTYSGPDSGQGASYSWVGNDQVGEGKMTINQSHPPQHIMIDLEFIKPFAQRSVTEFMFKPNGDKTDVTWSMSGQNGFLGKAFGLFMNMDKMVGADFEKGLAQLDKASQSK